MTSPSSSAKSSTVTLTNSSLINSLIFGEKWGGATGVAANVSYSFPWSAGGSAYFSGYNGADYSSKDESSATYRYGLDATQQLAAKIALQNWANVANISFTQSQDTSTNVGDIRFAFSSAVSGSDWGWARYPNSYWPNAGDVWINTDLNSNDWSIGSYNFEALMHEIGHAIGLKHPFEIESGNLNVLPTSWDSRIFTVMSYTNIAGHSDVNGFSYSPTTPMLLDIAAIQAIYGANTSFNSGASTYAYSDGYAKYYFETIWDGGGNNTITYDGNTASTIDLREGYGSYIGNKIYAQDIYGVNLFTVKNVWIAYGTKISSLVISGYGNNQIQGNNLGDKITDGSGSSVISCGTGNDFITGRGGSDVIDGGSGMDISIYSGPYSQYRISNLSAGKFQVSDANFSRDGVDTLTNIDRLQFSDYNVALDTDSSNSAGGIYRLYQAAFDRKPDLPGLGYWIKAADNGKSAVTMAEDFTWSKEFLDLFHLSTPKDNYFTGFEVKKLVEGMYTHVLHRAADSGGLNYYSGVIQSHEKTVGRVLAEISDSPENHTAVASSIANGIQYTPYTAQAMTSLHLIDDIEATVAEPQTMALDTYSSYSDQVDLIGQTHDPMLDWIWLG